MIWAKIWVLAWSLWGSQAAINHALHSWQAQPPAGCHFIYQGRFGVWHRTTTALCFERRPS